MAESIADLEPQMGFETATSALAREWLRGKYPSLNMRDLNRFFHEMMDVTF